MVGDAGQASARKAEAVREVARMLHEWEDSGELYTDFAERLMTFWETIVSSTSLAKVSD